MSKPKILSDREAALIVMGAIVAHGGEATEAELHAVLDWAIEARMDAAALQMALDGKIVVSARGGRIVYRKTTEDERERIVSAA